MLYTSKTVKISINLKTSEVIPVEGYPYEVWIFSNNGSGDVDTSVPAAVVRSPATVEDSGGLTSLYTGYVRIDKPGTWKFNFVVADELGNPTSLLEEVSVSITDMVPRPPIPLPPPTWDGVAKTLTFTF